MVTLPCVAKPLAVSTVVIVSAFVASSLFLEMGVSALTLSLVMTMARERVRALVLGGQLGIGAPRSVGIGGAARWGACLLDYVVSPRA